MGGVRFARTKNGLAKRNKFGTKKTADGFPSKLEASVYALLLLREKNGEISNIRRQHVVLLTKADIKSIVDFSYEDKQGSTVWVEAKGFATDVWNIKKRLWRYYGPGPLEIWKGNYMNPSLNEVIVPEVE